jgi:hypothetical protein
MRSLGLPLPHIPNVPWRKLPTLHFAELVHVGSLDAPLKRTASSYEGLGLSVCLDPEVWEAITPLGGPRWLLIPRDTRRETEFVDYHRLSKRQRAAITRVAVRVGWLRATDQFELRSYDEEFERTVCSIHATRADAESERGDTEGGRISPRTVFVATLSLQALWRLRFTHPLSDSMAEEVAHTLILEARGRYDGVYWDDDDDPVRLSAPRGVIFQSALQRWTEHRAT